MVVDIIAVKKFTIDIENLVSTEELNYLEAIVKYCADKDIEVEQVVPFINSNNRLKGKVYNHANDFNLVKKTARLRM
jgi:hypothetical protein